MNDCPKCGAQMLEGDGWDRGMLVCPSCGRKWDADTIRKNEVQDAVDEILEDLDFETDE